MAMMQGLILCIADLARLELFAVACAFHPYVGLKAGPASRSSWSYLVACLTAFCVTRDVRAESIGGPIGSLPVMIRSSVWIVMSRGVEYELTVDAGHNGVF